ncbi:MAG: hypothetical protein IT569_02885 [Leptospiraceae bacterium]|nr:hypothetical protein [Leptospiraceae bacterium]
MKDDLISRKKHIPNQRTIAIALLLFKLLILPSILTGQGSQENSVSENKKMYDPEKFLIMATPVTGGLNSTIEFPYRFPYFQGSQISPNAFSLLRGERELQGHGTGGGLEVGIVKGNWSYITVNFKYNDTPYQTAGNASQVSDRTRSDFSGSLNYIQYAWENRTQFVPTLGIGYFTGFIDTTIKDFAAYEPTKNSVIYASYVHATSKVVNPFPKVGLKIKLPIQHWHITPFYSYFYEEVTSNVSYGTGKVLSPSAELFSPFQMARSIEDESNSNILYPGGARNLRKYYQNIVGVNVFLDFHYFIQLRANVYRNLTSNLWTVRAFFTFFFHKNVGLSAYYEYAERITGKYSYWLVGPTFAIQF